MSRYYVYAFVYHDRIARMIRHASTVYTAVIRDSLVATT